MSKLLVKPAGDSGKVIDITPDNAKSNLAPDWNYVGFGLYHLAPGESAAEVTGDREVILVIVEGRVDLAANGRDFGTCGDRMSVFEKTKPVPSPPPTACSPCALPPANPATRCG
jgi:5-deoxy-glucuronate isomerase